MSTTNDLLGGLAGALASADKAIGKAAAPGTQASQAAPAGTDTDGIMSQLDQLEQTLLARVGALNTALESLRAFKTSLAATLNLAVTAAVLPAASPAAKKRPGARTLSEKTTLELLYDKFNTKPFTVADASTVLGVHPSQVYGRLSWPLNQGTVSREGVVDGKAIFRVTKKGVDFTADRLKRAGR